MRSQYRALRYSASRGKNGGYGPQSPLAQQLLHPGSNAQSIVIIAVTQTVVTVTSCVTHARVVCSLSHLFTQQRFDQHRSLRAVINHPLAVISYQTSRDRAWTSPTHCCPAHWLTTSPGCGIELAGQECGRVSSDSGSAFRQCYNYVSSSTGASSPVNQHLGLQASGYHLQDIIRPLIGCAENGGPGKSRTNNTRADVECSRSC